jgi:hypothetical protein
VGPCLVVGSCCGDAPLLLITHPRHVYCNGHRGVPALPGRASSFITPCIVVLLTMFFLHFLEHRGRIFKGYGVGILTL